MKETTLTRADGTVVCERCTLADSPVARMRGLLGRDGLEQGEGLLLRPASSIHTFFMRFPIDAVFLDRELAVVGIEDSVDSLARGFAEAARRRCSSFRPARARAAGSRSATSSTLAA